jgi:hypothetical protein
MTDENQDARAALAKILMVLDRREAVPMLESLASAVKGAAPEIVLANSALVLDANVFLRIPSNRKSADIMDYLTTVHEKPVVVPGQVIQEFWNNQLSATDTVYKALSKKFNELSKEVEKHRSAGVSGIDAIAEALDTFKRVNEHVFEPELVTKTSSFLERLVDRALVPFAPREAFAEVSVARKRAKTPPGFRDDGDGDFLVWVDLLWGLYEAQSSGASFDNVILLSHDAKIDWSRGKAAHPVLAAEVKAVLGADFEIWTLERLSEAIG